ncbi:replication initiator protein A [Hungatella sp. L12]|uniref:Replication initiator protein A n=1 Tax=Hungatella hominis TaxID=2763050 RepID=A0ABR7HGA3_9FIRM|nr:replication initiator protein A [Hungatella hominis]MBC5712178.1 replication initiator protein A [Hungatella hominis]
MTNMIYIHQPKKSVSFTRLSNFLFEAPTFTALSNEAKILYAFILRRTELSRKNGWSDEYGRIFLYYPIYEVVALLHCGRQKAVNTLRELQYAGLVEIQKQGCGKPNRIYPKSYEAVSNTDFKKSGSGTPEG